MSQQVSCDVCGQSKKIEPSKAKRNKHHFCSRSCRAKWISQYGHFVGKTNPRWVGGEVKRKCLDCGKDYLIGRFRIGKSKYCSQVCAARTKFSGAKNPRWKGGVSLHRDRVKSSEYYKAWRNKVFRRDYWTCQECGYKGNDIEAHHIRRWTDNPHLTFKVWNGITLCEKCHLLTYGKEEKFEKRYFKKTLNDYMPSILRKKVKI